MIAIIAPILFAQVAAHSSPVGVVVTSRRPGADAFASKIADRVHSSLLANGFGEALSDAAALKKLRAQKVDPRVCEATTACMRTLASALGKHAALVGVDVGKMLTTLVVHLEAVGVESEEPLAAVDFQVPVDAPASRWQEHIDKFVQAFLEKLMASSAAAMPPVAALDAPKETSTPASLPPPSTLPTASTVSTNKTTSSVPGWVRWAALGGTVVVAGLAGVFGAVGLDGRSKYLASLTGEKPNQTSSLTLEQANAFNTNLTLALGFCIGMGVLGALTGWAFLN